MIKAIIRYVEKKNWINRRLNEIRGLSGRDREIKMGAFLYDLSIDRATEFVKEELTRQESPFLNVDKPRFFHEIVLLTFWGVKKVIGNQSAVMDEIHRNYSENFNLMKTFSEDNDSLVRRYEIYSDSWDDVWGHQDMLGLEVARYIFGNRDEILKPDITFWLISYIDETIKAVEKVRKIWLSRGIKL